MLRGGLRQALAHPAGWIARATAAAQQAPQTLPTFQLERALLLPSSAAACSSGMIARSASPSPGAFSTSSSSAGAAASGAPATYSGGAAGLPLWNRTSPPLWSVGGFSTYAADIDEEPWPGTEEVKPRNGHEQVASIVFLQGLGDSSGDWAEILTDTLPEGVRIVTAKAPIREVTMNGGSETPAWFDVMGLEDRTQEACEGLEDSSEALRELVARELRRAPNGKVFLGGFSQGAAVALYTALKYPEEIGQRVAGVVAISGYIPRLKQLLADPASTWGETPVLICHGEADDLIPIELAHRTFQAFQTLGSTQVDLIEYQFLRHGVNMLVLKDVVAFVSPPDQAMGNKRGRWLW